MRKRLTLRSVLPILLFATASTFSQAAVQSRISAIGESSRVAVPHTIPARAMSGSDLGAAASDRVLDSMMVTFSRTDAQEAALTQLLIDLQDPSSPRYHAWLTPEQFGAQFGLSSQDLAKVSSWLTSQGFKITGSGRASNYITFTGSVAQAQAAFGTSIHSLMIDGEQHISNLTDPVLPAGIAAVTVNVSGLNDIKPHARARPRTVQVDPADTTGLHPQFTSSVSPGNHYIAPGDFYTIYDEYALLTSSCGANLCTGVGVGAGVGGGFSIAVAGQTNILLSDVTHFRTASGLCTTVSSACPNPLPTVNLYGTSPGTSQADLPEAMLDVEWAGAVAPNANVVFVNSTNVFSSLIAAISNNLAPIVSISYGNCEAALGLATLNQINQSLQQGNAQGQTIVGPSGDAGATDCDSGAYPAVSGLAVDFPASSPYATAAGGAMFNEGTATGATAYWGATTSANANAGTAIGYIPETVWNESSSTNGLGAGGGGASAYFTKPYWQTGATVPNDYARDTPDISLNSASIHDGSLYCVTLTASSSCVTGFRASDGVSLSVVGGTSVAAPSFAGVLALVEQKIGSRIGNAGPTLYALANSTYSATVFHDIISGNNNSPCTAGTQDCPSGGSIGYTAAAGYDLATGLGSVDVFNLANSWKLVTPTAVPTGSGQNITNVTLTTTNATCGTVNSTVVFTVKVTGSTSTTPTGTVQIMIDGVVTGAPIALSGGAASYSLVTTGLASGSHTVAAVYSGDTLYAGSKTSVLTNPTNSSGLIGSIDVVSSSKADFAFTPCLPSTTVRTGAVAPAVTFTVAPVNGFTGSVTFSATSDDPTLAANYSFSVTPVVISSTTSVTTNFVLTAYVSNAKTGTGSFKQAESAKQSTHTAPWYAAGSGVALASVLLLTLPKRRRWGALLAAVLSVAAFGVVGCSSGSGTLSTNTGTGTTTTTTNALPGVYNIRVTAFATTSAGTLTHSTNVTFNVTN